MALFGKPFQYTLLTVALVELLSGVAQAALIVGTISALLLLVAVMLLSLKKLEYGLYVVFGELFAGSQGHLLTIQLGDTELPLRIGLFLVILGSWLYQRLKTKQFTFKKNRLWYCYLGLFTVITIALVQGIVRNDFSNVFFDANAWIYFALAVVVFDTGSKTFLTRLVQVLLAATTWVALKTVVLLTLFSHAIIMIGDPIYQWLRDTGSGEITYVAGTIFRVFLQSQLYVLIGFFLVLTIAALGWSALNQKNKLASVGYLFLTGLAILVSQSRSFWVGSGVALISMLILLWWQARWRIKQTITLLLLIAALTISQMATLQLITGNFTGTIISDRFKGLQTEAAGISRLNQLGPLTTAVSQQPLFGYGFGKTLTYQSSDPRIVATHPDGWYTTYAFEWGYLDIALKLGILGLAVYLVLIGYLAYQLMRNVKLEARNSKLETGITLGLLIGLVAILVTNIFSPYLNHPLGIGYLLLLSALIIQLNKGYANDTLVAM